MTTGLVSQKKLKRNHQLIVSWGRSLHVGMGCELAKPFLSGCLLIGLLFPALNLVRAQQFLTNEPASTADTSFDESAESSLRSAETPFPAAQVDYTLRIVWGGKRPQPYQGSISIDRGSLSLIQNLNLQPDGAGCIQQRGSDRMEILPTSPTTFGGVDVRVVGTHASYLNFRLLDPLSPETPAEEHRVALHQLVEQDWIEPLDDRGSYLAVARAASDRLRVTPDREQLLFAPNQPWQLLVRGVKTGLPAGEYELRVRYVPNRTASQNASDTSGLGLTRQVTVDSTGNFPDLVLEWFVPASEGSFLAEFSLYRRRLMSILPNAAPAMTRRLELVVLNDSTTTRQRQIVRQWQPLFSVDLVAANQPGSLDWLAPWRGWSKPLNVRGMWEQVAFTTPVTGAAIRHGSLGERAVQFDSNSSTVDCLTIGPHSWIALPVKGLPAGQPHRLRVHVPMDQPMELATSVRSPEASGELSPLNRDAAMVIHQRECAVDAPLAQHELMFWPNEQTSYVMLVNPSDRLTATVSRLEVEQAIIEPAQDLAVLDFDQVLQNKQYVAPEEAISQRLVGLYIDKPVLIDSYSADRTLDTDSGRELDSWDAWLEATERLEFVMNWTDSNTLMIKVAADGAAIYPSQHLQPTLRYDSGAFFSDGRNPPVKDVVELLLRRFDREGKSLILALDIDSNLPALMDLVDRQRQERKASEQPTARQQAEIVQVNLQGETRSENGERRNIDRYNPLHPAVQNQLTLVVRELVERYGQHRSFRGIAIQLDRDSQFAFAGDRWGVDPRTLRQFVGELGVNLPSDEQLEQALRGPLRLAFLNWRAAKMTDLYRRLTLEVTKRRADAWLILNALRLWDQPPAETDFWNVGTMLRSPDEYLMAMGVDAAAVQGIEGLVLLQGKMARRSQTLASSDWILELASERALRQQPQSKQDTGVGQVANDSLSSVYAALVLQQPVGYQLEGSEQLGKIGNQASGSWMFPFAAQTGHQARKQWIDQLYTADVQLMLTGGWLPAGGHEATLTELHRAFCKLPLVPMQDVLPEQLNGQNLRVRQASFDGKTYLQLINNAPWIERSELEMHLLSTTDCQLRNLMTGELIPLQLDKGRGYGSWQVELPPFAFMALELNCSKATVTAVRHQPPGPVAAQLAAELRELEQAISRAGDPNGQTALASIGGDFESWTSSGKPRGWNVSSLPEVEFSRSSELPRSGNYSLSIVNRSRGEAPAWLQSESIPVPPTGRLVLQAWLRQPSTASAATVRLSVIGRTADGNRFERSVYYGGRSEGRSIANDWGQRPAMLFVSGIPEDVQDLQVAIDLIGSGKVWVDDVEVFEALLLPDERIYLRGQLLVAREGVEKGNLFVAERLLDSHWGHYIRQFSQAPQAVVDREVPMLEASRDVTRTAAEPVSNEMDQRANWNQTKPFFQQWREQFRDRWRR